MKFLVEYYMCEVAGVQSQEFETYDGARGVMMALRSNDDCECYNLKRFQGEKDNG